MLIVSIILGLFALWLLLAVAHWAYFAFAYHPRFPAMPAAPLLGHLIYNPSLNDAFNMCVAMQKTCGPVTKVITPVGGNILISDMDAIKQVLNTPCSHGDPIIAAIGVVASGLTGAAPDQEHRILRKVFAPYFNQPSGVRMMHPALLHGCEFMGAYLKAHGEKEDIDVQKMVTRALWDTFMGVLFGVKSATLQQNDLSNYDAWRRLNEMMNRFAAMQINYSNIAWSQDVKQYHRDRAAVLGLVRTLVDQLSAEWKDGVKDQSALSFALENNPDGVGHMDKEAIVNHMMNFLWASHDSTRVAFSFAVYHILKDERIRDRLVEEISTVVGSRVCQPDDFAAMPYLDGIVKETLRLYPPFPLLSRQIKTPINLRGAGNGEPIAANTIFFLNFFDAMRDPKLFDKPTEFVPERWLAAGKEELAMLVAFGGGGRRCIGEKIALVNVKTLLLHVFQHFDLRLVSTEAPLVGMKVATELETPVLIRATARS